MMRSVVFILLVSAYFALATRLEASGPVPYPPNRVTKLPGLASPLTSSTYTGYLPVDVNGTVEDRALFYFLFSSQSANADKDSLVVWLNGGPGARRVAHCKESHLITIPARCSALS